MEKIEDMGKMRARVDKLSKDDSKKETIHGLAIEENKERKRQKEVLSGRYGIQESLGSEGMNEAVDRASDSFLETAEAREETMIDPLTGLRNRRAYNEDIPKGLAMTYKRVKKNCSLLFLDLDFFKGINDTHGHDAGNAVLKEFADMIKTMVREYDITYRIGGEEFVVFLPGANLRVAKEVAERIKKKVAENIFNATNEKDEAVEMKITVSIGCASTESPNINEEMESKGILDKLGKESDSALYGAKKSGRNRVLSFDEIPAKTKNS